MSSPAFSLNKEDIVKTIHLSITLFGPAILILIDQAQAGSIDFRYIGSMCLTIILETLRRYIQGQESNT